MKELRASQRTQSVLQACGVWTDLRAACATLARTAPELIRSMMISGRAERLEPDVGDSIVRYAEEHCLAAEVEHKDGRLVIRLRRVTDGGAR